VTTQLEVRPGESPAMRPIPLLVVLPEVCWLDLDAAAQSLGWTLSQLVSYLAIQGILRVVERAEPSGASA
jgi:hypothetical protein